MPTNPSAFRLTSPSHAPNQQRSSPPAHAAAAPVTRLVPLHAHDALDMPPASEGTWRSQIAAAPNLRRLWNGICHRGLGFQRIDARCTYPRLRPDYAPPRNANPHTPSTIQQLAERHVPQLFSTQRERLDTAELTPSALYYEALPPSLTEPQTLSLIYYAKTPNERHPNALLRKIYDTARPMLWGSLEDIEAIRVDINTTSWQPSGLEYETCQAAREHPNYSAYDPWSLHQKVRIEHDQPPHWHYHCKSLRPRQPIRLSKSPFNPSGSLPLSYVSWNGGFEVLPRLQQRRGASHQPQPHTPLLHRLPALQPQPLSAASYAANDLDLRSSWLRPRKQGGRKAVAYYNSLLIPGESHL